MTVAELNGWAPATVTRDVEGNVLSISTTEPRFTVEQKALLLMARRKKNEPRGSHGLTYAEATDPKNFGRFKVPLPTTDLAAKALREAREAWKKAHGEDSLDDLLFRVELDR